MIDGDNEIDIHTNQILLMRMLANAYQKFGNDFIVNFISSWFVYGKWADIPAKESTPCNPTGFYSITKYAAEKLLQSYCETTGAKYRILRLANVLGLGDMKASLRKNSIQFIIQELETGRDVKVYVPSSVRDCIGVEDCVDAIRLVLTKGNTNEIYNIGTGIPIEVNKLFKLVEHYSEGKIIEIPIPEFHKQVQERVFYMDISKLRELGYVPKLAPIIEFYRYEPG
jgi:nucleoside-diphosphate-sugar epimerase